MYQWLFRTGRFWAIAIFVVLLVALSVNRFEPYKFAEDRMTAAIQENPGIESRLDLYGQKANEWRSVTNFAVQISKVIVSLFDKVKIVHGWSMFLDWAGKVPGRRIFIENADDVAHSLLALDNALEKVSLSTNASNNFSRLTDDSSYLSEDELKQIYENNTDIILGLVEINNGLRKTSEYIRDLFKDSELTTNVLTTFDDWRTLAEPGTENLADSLYDGIQAWKGLPDTLDEIQRQIDSDVTTVSKVSFWYGVSTIIDCILDFLFVRHLAQWVIDRQGLFILAIAVCVAFSVGGWFGSFTVQQARWRGLTKPKVIVIDRPQRQYQPTPTPRRKKQKPIEPTVTVKVDNSSYQRIQTIPLETKREISLVCNWRDGRREVVSLPNSGKLTIGSSSIDDVQTNPVESAISQVMIKRAKTFFYVDVLDTTYPSKLNGQIITGARKLNPGDIITIGDLSAVLLA